MTSALKPGKQALGPLLGTILGFLRPSWGWMSENVCFSIGFCTLLKNKTQNNSKKLKQLQNPPKTASRVYVDMHVCANICPSADMKEL